MARQKSWTMSPGETLALAKSLAGDLGTAEVMTGESPTVTVHQRGSDGLYTDVTSDFTVASEQVNTGALTTDDGETIAIGKGVSFLLTATETAGEYEVRVECDGDESSHAVARVPLYVVGPGTP